MFRRKEDEDAKDENNLFGNAIDGGQPGDAIESAQVISPRANTPQAPNITSHTASAVPPAHAHSAAQSAPQAAAAPQSARPMESRPGNVPTASSFRAGAAPLSSDMARNRMPEVKQPGGIPAQTAATADKGTKGRGRVLTVGNDILLKGEIATCDRLVIEGKVDATLNDVHTVEIAETGSFKGSAHIEDAEISGLFEGDLVVANRLVIYATGKVRGKITYGEIEIERGGELTGEIKTIAQLQSQSQAPNRPTSSRPVTAPKDDKVAA